MVALLLWMLELSLGVAVVNPRSARLTFPLDYLSLSIRPLLSSCASSHLPLNQCSSCAFLKMFDFKCWYSCQPRLNCLSIVTMLFPHSLHFGRSIDSYHFLTWIDFQSTKEVRIVICAYSQWKLAKKDWLVSLSLFWFLPMSWFLP